MARRLRAGVLGLVVIPFSIEVRLGCGGAVPGGCAGRGGPRTASLRMSRVSAAVSTKAGISARLVMAALYRRWQPSLWPEVEHCPLFSPYSLGQVADGRSLRAHAQDSCRISLAGAKDSRKRAHVTQGGGSSPDCCGCSTNQPAASGPLSTCSERTAPWRLMRTLSDDAAGCRRSARAPNAE